MTAEYRILHFVPDPFVGTRIPVAALVRQGSSLGFAKACFVPGPACVGSRESELLAMTLDSLQRVESFDVLPSAVGPHFVLEQIRAVPGTVEEPVAWVQRHVLPAQRHVDHQPKSPRQPKRAVCGFRFMETWTVARYVKKDFNPAVSLFEARADHTAMPKISHWVGTPEHELVLMEPVALERSHLDDEVREINTRFAAYRFFLDRGGFLPASTKLLAYILPHSTNTRSESVSERLSAAHEVVDTASERERLPFIEMIRTVGSRYDGQNLLVL